MENCWISIENPSVHDCKYLLEELQIPESFYNDIEDIDERPRIETENGWYLIILRIPYKNADSKLPFTTVPLGIVFKDDIFVSICFHEAEMIHNFIPYTQRKNVDIKNHFDDSYSDCESIWDERTQFATRQSKWLDDCNFGFDCTFYHRSFPV